MRMRISRAALQPTDQAVGAASRHRARDSQDVHSPDLSELSATRHVRHLRAAGCGVEDASAVMAATQLLSADLRDNAIKRWPRLAGRVRPRMQRLDVSRNALKSLGGIMELRYDAAWLVHIASAPRAAADRRNAAPPPRPAPSASSQFWTSAATT